MTPSNSRRTRSRRFRFGAMTTMIVLAATTSLVIAAALANRFTLRLDTTSSRRHSLSQRTLNLLDELTHPIEVVLIADDRQIDRRVRQRVGDVLDSFDHASSKLRVTRINPVSEAGRAQFTELRSRVSSLYESDIAAQRLTVAEAVEEAGKLTNQLASLSDALLALRAPLTQTNDPLAPRLENLAAIVRLQARRLEPIVSEAQAAVDQDRSGASELESARTSLTPALAALSDELTNALAVLERSTDQPSLSGLNQTISTARLMRDRTAVRVDALDRLGSSEAAVVQRMLESTDAVVILSPSRSTAIRFDSLFPSSQTIDSAGGSASQMRFIGEELIATAIATLVRPAPPIVVLVHSLPGRLLSSAGGAASPQAREAVGSMLDRLKLRGMSLAEWPVTMDPSPPTLARLNPNGDRPIVWLAFGTEGASAEAASRFDRYSRAVQSLIDQGQALLLCAAPSTRPASGADDPIAAALKPLGVEMDTGRPIIHRLSLATGDAFELGFTLVNSMTDHPIGAAIDGLPSRLAWLTPIRFSTESESIINPILQLNADDDMWAEAEWLSIASAPDDRPWASASPPTPNDSFDDVAGPWTVAAAIERASATSANPQRVVVVASPGWFFDRIANQTTTVEGRPVTLYPGNMELLEASLYWLSHRDEMIAPSPRIMEVPRIATISSAQLTALRWALILGMPSLTLLVGILFRFTLFR